MFERTRALISRLSHRSPEPKPGEHGFEDRRVHPRQLTNIDTTWRLITDPSHTFYGRIRNISPMGMNLLVYRAVRDGSMIQIDLPRPDGSSGTIVLACVVRVIPEETGNWGLGCTFSVELGDEALMSFGGNRQLATGSDQRVWVRQTSSGTATWPHTSEGQSIQASAEIVDISPAGVGLLSKYRVEPGDILTMQLSREEHGQPLTILACASNLFHREDGLWRVGCCFIRELSDAEFQVLM